MRQAVLNGRRATFNRVVNQRGSLSDPSVHLAYTTTARRQHYNYGLAFHAAKVDGLRAQLRSSLEQVDSQRPFSSTLVPSVAFTFTGQGASYKSSNLQLFHHSPVFRSQILTLNALAKRLGFPSFIPANDGSHDKDYDHGAVITQVALTSVEIALAKYWESLGIKPDIVLGHSLSEYAALCVAGVLSASDAICLVGKRAEMLQEKCEAGSYGMLAVQAPLDEIKAAAGALNYGIACINSPNPTVLGGTWQELEAVRAALGNKGHHCATIDVPFAFHSAQTDPILQDFEAYAREGVLVREPRIPIISPLLANVICDGKTVDSTYLRRATRETCDFLGAVNRALEIGIIDKDVFWIEMDPHSVNTSFLKAILGPNCVALTSLRRREDSCTTLADSLTALHSAGLEVHWKEFYRPFESKLRLLDLPTYSWNNKNYWIQYDGDWALMKGNTFYEGPKQTKAALSLVSFFQTSLVQAIIHEEFHGTSGTMTMQSDLMSADIFAAAHGHSMNGCGVVTSSIRADIACTLGEYMTKKLGTPVKYEHLNIANLKVAKGLVAQTDTSRPQLIRVTASTSNIANGIKMQWHNVDSNGTTGPEPFATATVLYGDADENLKSWVPITHLVESRIETLQDMARKGQATQFSRKMAYSLFASSLVDYADKYRGMSSVVMYEFEAFADVQLTTEEGGVWTVPPYFIDSVAHLAGFIMNVTDAHDTAGNFCVTPGWQSMLLARPLEAGAQYRSYVKMIPSRDDAGVFCGDVYIMRGGEIVGMVGGIQFRHYPRILLDRFFSPPDSIAAKSFASSQIPQEHSSPKRNAPRPVSSTASCGKQAFLDGTRSPVSALAPSIDSSSGPSSIASAPKRTEAQRRRRPLPKTPKSITVKAKLIIASQTGIDVAELSDDTRLGDVGVDSLISLVIAERFRGDLDIVVNSSLFLEYPTLGALKEWLREYYNYMDFRRIPDGDRDRNVLERHSSTTPSEVPEYPGSVQVAVIMACILSAIFLMSLVRSQSLPPSTSLNPANPFGPCEHLYR
ncbi:Conidial yellow pigment biosynthesis polyketide synthase 1 [Colletotrichum chlorophyti]|uniref:Conidial yellow pigment biosynthesis polyketide synthase 1 n=1 Tax=Colletotrichum chlorophyti TaxID=708187 RepID=A0A1Q8S6G2_9PEZI|nr:Conidial yellow pigment biosynthesis polyketide synthase 1 [Colletotrichum chlorophyti]